MKRSKASFPNPRKGTSNGAQLENETREKNKQSEFVYKIADVFLED